jgi:hypothetical protein
MERHRKRVVFVNFFQRGIVGKDFFGAAQEPESSLAFGQIKQFGDFRSSFLSHPAHTRIVLVEQHAPKRA